MSPLSIRSTRQKSVRQINRIAAAGLEVRDGYYNCFEQRIQSACQRRQEGGKQRPRVHHGSGQARPCPAEHGRISEAHRGAGESCRCPGATGALGF
eukprot:gene8991-11011_t